MILSCPSYIALSPKTKNQSSSERKHPIIETFVNSRGNYVSYCPVSCISRRGTIARYGAFGKCVPQPIVIITYVLVHLHNLMIFPKGEWWKMYFSKWVKSNARLKFDLLKNDDKNISKIRNTVERTAMWTKPILCTKLLNFTTLFYKIKVPACCSP